ncbi:ABC transporter substrate-binding protein [Roseateles violae]|uniref:Helical backbone metal receptor n=1 Tax=Roseateles violae TaxID=3058042 RepID=A0ABT8DVV2_9BURK|nr:helical backbone metal receptor [Pelomonas sp. PFR6]MDN3922392.1 helical backbone metal receptor [Pelomonas sp. PFR6]
MSNKVYFFRSMKAALPLLALLGGLAQPAGAYQLKDDAGHVSEWSAPPQRIVSMVPSLTETVCALGACARLVGVDRYSNHPPQVAALPKLGGIDDSNIETIVALRPDVVLVSPSSRMAERLQALGLKVVTLESKSYADVRRVLGKTAQLLAVQDTDRLWRGIEAGVGAAAQSLPPAARSARVYYEVASGPYGAGESSFIGEIIARLGARNIIPASMGPFPKINPEFVVRANPDVIMVGSRDAEGITARPGWERISAVRRQQICVFSREEGDVLVRPGPRLAEAAQIMARCLREHSGGGDKSGTPR